MFETVARPAPDRLAARATRMLGCLSAALMAASLISANGAGAATLSLSGGATEQLNVGAITQGFDPSGISAINADGIVAGSTVVTYFLGPGAVTDGLFVTPHLVNIKFDYMGKEAGYTNGTFLFGGTQLFSSATSTPGVSTATVSNYDVNPTGLVPIYFQTNCGGSCNRIAQNGGPINSDLGIAFAKVTNSIYYAFFDDGGAGPDRDWDDMVVRITVSDVPQQTPPPPAVPLPASLPLFAGGLGLLGLLARRRKKKTSSSAVA